MPWHLNHSIQARSKWATPHHSTTTPSAHHPDTIDAYLESPPLTAQELEQAGGPLAYWERALVTRPRLARMALDFLTAPGGYALMIMIYCHFSPSSLASSVDAERAFSAGRLQVNHLQHGVSSQTFRAQVAIGSWSQTPLMPNLHTVTSIIDARRKGKGKQRADVIEIE
jgi:hypothetical protein